MSGGKATAVRLPSPGKNLGRFRCRHFNLFDSKDLDEYQELRQLDSDLSSGIQIAMMREFVRKVRDEEYSGEDKTVHEEDHPYVYIEWWEKKIRPTKGDSYDEKKKASEGWRD